MEQGKIKKEKESASGLITRPILLSILEDIDAARKRLEETNNYLDSIIKSMIDSLIVISPDTTIKTVNQAALDLLDYKEDELTGKPVAIIFEEELFKGSGLEDLIKKGFLSNVEKNCLAKDGRSIPLLFSGSVMRDPDGQILGIVCVGRDITDRKQAEKELKEYSERLEERTKKLEETQEELVRKEKLAAIGLLAGGVGHELRNPLGVISNSAYYLDRKLKDADEKVRKHLNILRKEVQRGDAIISQLLDFSRMQLPSLVKGNVNSILKDVLAEIKLPKNISLEWQPDENLPRIRLDLDQIGRVCQNIISNAIQAMSEGGKLVLKTRTRADFVEITFQDTGQGIPRENLAKVFEPLFTTRAKGIGLGLAIVKSLVEGHKGKIEVESEVGKGTKFTVKLPLELNIVD